MRWLPYKLKDGTNARHTIASTSGYCILRCTRMGIPDGNFLAFYGKTTATRMPLVLGGYPSIEDAKAACDAHEAQQKEIA